MQRDKVLKKSQEIKSMLDEGVNISEQLKRLNIENLTPQSYRRVLNDFLTKDYQNFINNNACIRSCQKIIDLFPLYRNDVKSLYIRLIEDEELSIQNNEIVPFEYFKEWVINEFK